MGKTTLTLDQAPQRLRALVKSLRPYEREADKLAKVLVDELVRLEEVPEEEFDADKYDDLDRLQGMAENIFAELETIRRTYEEFTEYLREKAAR